MDKIVHFEIPADDVARAKDFYGSIFEWGLDDMEGMDYTIVRTVDVDEQQLPKEPGAINGRGKRFRAWARLPTSRTPRATPWDYGRTPEHHPLA